MTRHKHAARCPPRGFTLIELLVVVAIIVVIVGLAGIQLIRGPGDLVREESEHLALLLRAAREEAILQGRVFAFGAGRESYRFLRLERNGRLKLASGEATGRLDTMLARAAEAQSRELENWIRGLTALLEPLLILAMGGVVLFVVVAILLPIFEMNQLVR